MTVKFIAAHALGALYNIGDVAGFDAETEADLVERKIAEPLKAKAGKGEKPAPSAPFEARETDGKWAVYQGDKVVASDLADEDAAKSWIAAQPKA